MLWIKNGYLVDPKSKKEGYYDILIEEDKIASIVESGKNLTEHELSETTILDVKGCIVAPGLVDVHSHFREPGFTYKETIASGAKAAARGGFTTVVLMANTKPPVDNKETLSYVLTKAKEADIHVETCATITVGMQGSEIVPMEELLAGGAVGFTDDGIPIMEEAVLRKAMECSRILNVPLSLHEEDPAWITNPGINSTIAMKKYGCKGSPREAEIEMVRRDLQIAIETNAIVNIQHISAKEAVELVREAKKKSSTIHAEATPHHVTLTEEAVEIYGTLAKMNPPLRTEEDRQAILEGLADGTIDLIATDHAPHSEEEKAKSLTEAPSGIIGLETALSLGITQLVKTNTLTRMQLLEKMTYAPAKLYGLQAGYLEEGGPADILIFEEEATWTVGNYCSKSTNSPFTGETLNGVVRYTLCSGNIVYQQSV